MEPDIAELRRMIDEAQRIVFFTGAGISTESGIPDFRSPGGIWTRMKPIDFSEFLASDEARRETWRRRFATDATMRKAEPNRGHRAVATLVNRGKASAVITQNIDGLHQASGVPASRVIELHGNTTYAHCLDCAQRYEIEDIRIEFERTGEAPCCVSCGGHVKTATVSFGQSMPPAAMIRAEEETLASDLFITIGSSLVVYPAAGFPGDCGAQRVAAGDPEPRADRARSVRRSGAAPGDRRDAGRGGRQQLTDERRCMARNIAVGVGLMEFPFSSTDGFWRWVDLCEAGGIDSIWQTDRIVSRQPILECMTALAAIAGRTRRIKFGVNVVSLALRDPVLLAKQCATIDVLSQGRLLPGFGIGSPQGPEWQTLHIDTATRGRKTDEALEIIHRLWSEDSVDFEGRHNHLTGASISPKPVQPDLPIWIGGSSAAAVRRTARYGTGWQAGAETAARCRAGDRGDQGGAGGEPGAV